MSEGQFYWHVHHDVLLEWSDDIEKRRGYIKQAKSVKEIPLRLKLLKPVWGNLPDEVAGAWTACNKAWAAYREAWAAYDKAEAACNEAEAAYEKAWAAYLKARAACNETWVAYRKAQAAYLKALADHQEEIEALHRRECPGCPWDGETIFPGKEDER